MSDLAISWIVNTFLAYLVFTACLAVLVASGFVVFSTEDDSGNRKAMPLWSAILGFPFYFVYHLSKGSVLVTGKYEDEE